MQDLKLALLAHQMGQFDEALTLYGKIPASSPEFIDACYNAALIHAHQEALEEADHLSKLVIEKRPDDPAAHHASAKILSMLGKHDKALTAIRAALIAEPGNMEFLVDLGMILQAAKNYDRSLFIAAEPYLSLPADLARLWLLIGDNLRREGKETFTHLPYEEAENAYKKCLQHDPRHVDCLVRYASVLFVLRRYKDAKKMAEKATRLAPDNAQAWARLARTLTGIAPGKERQAIQYFQKAVDKGFDEARAGWSIAFCHLRTGDFAKGWQGYAQWRFKRPDRVTPPIDGPIWDGQTTVDKLVVNCEQGFGDSLQFARFLSLIGNKASSVILACQAPLVDLFRTRLDIGRDIDIQSYAALDHNVLPRIALMDLPLLAEDKNDLLAKPYLKQLPANPGKFPSLHQVQGPKIGFVWAGNLSPDPMRSCPLQHFAALADDTGLTFHSLHVGDTAKDLACINHPALIDLSPDIHSFADTATAIDAMDLVITIDTSVAHLAAAMGKDTWILLPMNTDWRWHFDTTSSRWYPNTRLFRQQKFNDWGDVFKDVRRSLEKQFPTSAR